MIAANRRHRLLLIALAGMEVAWSLPWLHWLLARGPQPLPLPAGALLPAAWALFLLYTLAAEWINRRGLESPRRELAAAALVLLTTLAGEAVLFAARRQGLTLAELVAAFFSFRGGLRPALLLLGYNLFLWWRVAATGGRDLGFFSVGLSFRFNMLLALLGNGLLVLAAGAPTGAGLLYLWSFFAFGLVAGALARIDDKSFSADQSTGALLPWGRFAQLLAAAAATLGLSAAAALLWSPAGFARLGSLLAPVARPLGWLVQFLVAALIWLLTPAILLLERLIQSMRAQSAPPPPVVTPAAPLPADLYSMGELVNQWAALRYCLVIGGVVLALGLIWLFFVRTVAALRADQPEETAPDLPELGRSGARRSRRGFWSLLRRTGLGRGLLAAISVQNLYANVTRIARRRGYPRAPAQPPDAYLPTLQQAFPGADDALARLTAAYMRVHYGDARVSSAELASLRREYIGLTQRAHDVSRST